MSGARSERSEPRSERTGNTVSGARSERSEPRSERTGGPWFGLLPLALITVLAVAACGQSTPATGGSQPPRTPPTVTVTRPAPPSPPPASSWTGPTATTAQPDTAAATASDGTVQQAAQDTVAAGSARVLLETDVAVDGHTSRMTGEGVLDFTGGVGEMTYRFDDGEEVRQVLLPDAVYVRLPGDPEQWYETDLDQQGLTPLGTGDPVATLTALARPGKVRQDGSETVDGIATTRYVLQVPAADLMAASGLTGEQVDGLGPAIAEAPDAVVTAWIDDGGRVVQYQQDLTLDSASSGAISSSTLVRFLDFGVDVDVSAPPGDLVVPAPEGLDGQAEAGEGA